MIKQKEKLYGDICPLYKIVRIVPDGSNFSKTEFVRQPRHFT